MSVGQQIPRGQVVTADECPMVICEPIASHEGVQPVHNPFEEIRKHPTTARITNLREADFRRALGKYVAAKLHIRALEKRYQDQGGHWIASCLERDKWRTLMDKIEFGLEYEMPLS